MSVCWGSSWAFVAALAQDPSLDGPPAPQPFANSIPVYEARYKSSAETALFLEALALAAPEHVRSFELATTGTGRVVSGLEISNPGALPAAERPTLLLIGGLDGKSLCGSETVTSIAHALVESSDALGQDLTVIAIPFASPEALDRCAATGADDGLDARPVDEDRDGAEGEDPPDDLDGDGFILQMLIVDPDGPWTRAGDSRFLVPARAGDTPRFLLVPEGKDDDGDGRYNEDPPGGVVLERNFPLLRDGSPREPHAGALPLSEPVSRAIADLALSRRTFACVLFQGNHGSLAVPGATRELDLWSEADRALYLDQARAFARSTTRPFEEPCALLHARGAPAPGAALDWFAAVVGALSLEVASWGPRVDAGGGAVVRDARYQGTETLADPRSAPCASDRAWGAWIDNNRGGLGFVEWHPIELAGNKHGFVGGFEPWTVDNPPLQSLPKALAGQADFVRELASNAPRLSIDTNAEREGALVTLRATVRNLGKLPTGLSAKSAVRNASGVTVEVVLPAGARLLAGAARQELAPLAGGDATRELRWLVHAPAGAALALRAQSPWCAPVTSEVAP